MKKLDFAGLNSYLLPRASTLLSSWLPGGRVVGNEYKCGDLAGAPGDSFSVNLSSGKWADFATGERGGDLVSLYGSIKRLDPGASYQALAGDHGYLGRAAEPLKIEGAQASDLSIPPPGTQPPNMNHSKYGAPVESYEYRDLNGTSLHFIAKFIEADGKKQFVPFSWSKRSGGWVKKAWPKPRPLYGLPALGRNPLKPVMIVEGEKACHAAQAIEGSPYVVLTWSGGAQAWKQADWSPLTGRDIVIWPDADNPGVSAAAGIAGLLVKTNKSVKIIDVSGQPDGWDAADSGFDLKALISWAKPRARLIELPRKPEVLPPEDQDSEIEVRDSNLITPDHVWNHLPDKNKAGSRAHATLENFQTLLKMLGVVIRYNVIAKREEVLIPNESFSIDNRGNAAYAWLLSWMNAAQIPSGPLKNFITFVAEKNQFNPVLTWINSKPWDGQSRLQDLYQTVKAKNEAGDPVVKHLKEVLIRRWLISAIAAAALPDGVSAHGVLVFQGAQYIGKTMWFKKLVPRELELVSDGRILRPDDKDSVKQIVSFWLVELGELDATFRKSDIAQLKAFLTKDKDILRAAYAATESEFARRTVFFASVNPEVFLHDETGNRRFWTIACESIDYDHKIDMQQLWAEVKTLFDQGESWFLDKQEMSILNDHNEGFTGVDSVQERIGSDLAWASSQEFWMWKTVTQVLIELGYERPTRSELNSAGAELRKRNGGLSKKNDGRIQLKVPLRLGSSTPLIPSIPLSP